MNIDRYFIYNPYPNKNVTEYYTEIIAKALETSGFSVKKIDALISAKTSDGIVVVHPKDVIAAKKKGYQKVLLWLQGITPEESFLRNGSYLRKAVLSCREYIGLRRANVIFMVSKKMQEHYEKKYHIKFQDNVYLMPCFNTAYTASAFDEPEKYTKNVFTYTGTLTAWQCFEETVQLYCRLEQVLPDCSFEVYTREQDEAEKVLKKYHVQHYHIDYVSPLELTGRLQKAKFGFVLREDTAVNRVATPTKLSTYLSAGVIPVFSTCLHDFYIHTRHCRYTLPVKDLQAIEDNVAQIKSFCQREVNKEEIRKEYAEIFQSYYNTERYVHSIADFLNDSTGDSQ